MSEATPKNLFLQSLERCSGNEGFMPAFYENFLGSSQEIRDKFRNTDFEHQQKMLLRSLKLSAGATAGDHAALRELRERAETHDRHHLDIKPELYALWLDAIVKTAHEFDEMWNDEIEQAWRVILEHVIHQMVRYY